VSTSITSPLIPVTATGTPLGAVHATGGPDGTVVVVLAEVVVGNPTEATVVVVDGNTGLIGCTVAPAQPTSRMSATKRPGSLFIRLNFGTARRLSGLEGQRIRRPAVARSSVWKATPCAGTGSIR
jgi:hypothetical protein